MYTEQGMDREAKTTVKREKEKDTRFQGIFTREKRDFIDPISDIVYTL